MKLLIAHERPLVRDGLRAILEGAGFVVVGTASTGSEALTAALEHHPRVTILNETIAGTDCVTTTRRLRVALPSTGIVGLCGQGESARQAAILAAGAHACLAADAGSGELFAVLRSLERRSGAKLGNNDGPAAPAATPRAPSSRPTRRLSARECEVLKLLAEGHSSKEIAKQLAVAVPTVETHRRQIVDKLGVRSVARLTKWAIRAGITTLE